MLFPPKKPTRQERIEMALMAIPTVDVYKGTYRATEDPEQKEQWLRDVWASQQVRVWAGNPDLPSIFYRGATGTVKFYRTHRDGYDLGYGLGKKPATDADLAFAFGYSARMAGWPVGARKASGLVHDPEMVMLTVAALWVHSPARAKELFQMYEVMGVPVREPATGWDPASWK